jgi:hypothetical protein
MSAPLQEEDIVPSKRLLEIFVGVIVVGVSLCLVAWLLLYINEGHYRPSHRFPERELPPPHRVSEIRQEVFSAMKVTPENGLDSYQRIDATHAKIPIDRAIELVVSGVRP